MGRVNAFVGMLPNEPAYQEFAEAMLGFVETYNRIGKPPAVDVRQVTATIWNVRSVPEMSAAAVVGQLKQGARVVVMDYRYPEWVYHDGGGDVALIGWSHVKGMRPMLARPEHVPALK